MPAIQPARLKHQVADLVSKYDQPDVFLRTIRALLDSYSDYTRRPSQAGIPSSLLESYNAPPPVMRQVWHELSRLIEPHPQEMLCLADTLWSEQNYDLQLLATRILGQLPTQPPELVLQHLQTWVTSDLDRRVLDGLLEHGVKRFQVEAPAPLLELVSSWLSSPELSAKHAGLRALPPMIDQVGQSYLPTIFRMVTPYLRFAPTRLRPDILVVVRALIRCSPSETAYLLRQNLTVPDNPDTAWLIRQVLGDFPYETREGLKAALKPSN
ncbi:MAG: hypothetical protein C3F13_05065 [Anaerolineales bacterium]|nr:MAG: hypothetical protein C3F13_05065 [Anaerolineales bacterium]